MIISGSNLFVFCVVPLVLILIVVDSSSTETKYKLLCHRWLVQS